MCIFAVFNEWGGPYNGINPNGNYFGGDNCEQKSGSACVRCKYNYYVNNG